MFFGRKAALNPVSVESAAAPEMARFSPRSPSDALKPTMAPPPPPRIRRDRGGMLSALSGFLTFFVVGAIATLLKREGVINQTFLFELQAFISRQRGPLKAGEFLFKARTSIDSAID